MQIAPYLLSVLFLAVLTWMYTHHHRRTMAGRTGLLDASACAGNQTIHLELPDDWEDHPGFVVWRQVRNGMWIRAALFAVVHGADEEIRARARRFELIPS